MMKKHQAPKIIDEFNKIGGVVDFSFFSDVDSLENCAEAAFREHFSSASMWSTDFPNTFDATVIGQLPRRAIWKKEFLGNSYDADRKMLRLVGGGTLTDGTELENPTFEELFGKKTSNWANGLPDVGSGGNFAYAFSQPPYGLQADYKEKQRIFDAVMTHLFPDQIRIEITDWSSTELTKLSSYFLHGMDWWGVFLFTLYAPSLRQLTVISASTSD
jgi:hypothetical protein